MRRFVNLTLFAILHVCVTGFRAYGQTLDAELVNTSQQNGLQQIPGKADSLGLSLLSKNDSLTNNSKIYENNIDSARKVITNNRHLSAADNKIDSIQNAFNNSTDSLQQ